VSRVEIRANTLTDMREHTVLTLAIGAASNRSKDLVKPGLEQNPPLAGASQSHRWLGAG
jgi:hypothetical protein